MLTALLVAVILFSPSKRPVLVTVITILLELKFTFLRVNFTLTSVVVVAEPPVTVALPTGELFKS